MSKKLAIIAAGLLAVTPAWAQNATCIEPAPVKIVDGNTATQVQMREARDQVAAFISQSDIYQTCIANDLEAKRKAASATNAPFDTELEQVARAKIAFNQQAKDQAAQAFNSQIAAYQKRSVR